MLKYALFLFFTCFVLNNLYAQNTVENPNADLIFPNFSVIALDEPSYRAFPGPQREKMFVVVAYIKANWFRAQEICSYQGLTLASINSKAESDVLNRYLTRAGLNSHDESFWLGGSKLSSASRWVWFSTGRPISYENWSPGQPDNFQNKEKCLELYSNGKWNDLPCEVEIYFICETRCPLTSYDSPIFNQKK